MNSRPLLLLALAALALNACGKRGGLERPGPLWGHKDGGEPVAVHRTAPDAPETQNTSARKDPVDTGHADPVGSPGDFIPR